MSLKYKYLEHTADLCIEIYYGNDEDLLTSVKEAFYNYVLDKDKLVVEKETIKKIKLDGNDIKEIAIDFINEMNYLLTVKKVMIHDFQIESMGRNYVLKCQFQKITNIASTLKHEVKAATHSSDDDNHQENKTIRIVLDL